LPAVDDEAGGGGVGVEVGQVVFVEFGQTTAMVAVILANS
jgi:hypothetical protein